jgi:small conductance mechanosensitive channel
MMITSGLTALAQKTALVVDGTSLSKIQSLAADADILHRLAGAAGDLVVRFAVAGLVLILTLWASGWAARFVRRLFDQFERHRTGDQTLRSFAASLVRYAVLVVGGVAVLQQLGVQTTSVLAVLGAASLAVGLALQGALSNVAAGVMLLLFRPYRVGDFVEIGGRQGTVKALDLFVTELATVDNVKVIAPNGKVFGELIVNFTHHAERRVDLIFRIDFHDDLAKALETLRRVGSGHSLVLPEPSVLAEAMTLSDSWAEVALRAWVKREDYGVVRSELLIAAKRALAEEGFLVPYPHQVAVQRPEP